MIAVVDCTPVFRRGINEILAMDGYEVSEGGSVDDAEDLLGRNPDLLLLDARLLAADATLCGRAAALGINVVLVIPKQEINQLTAVVADGVTGLWDRDGEPLELRRTVSRALGGETVVSAEAGVALLERIVSAGDSARARVVRLTAREREILTLMADGVGNRAIAEALFISENTVRNHVRNVLDKLQARTRTEAVVRAIRSGLVRIS